MKKIMKKQLVIFDFDGTLIDTRQTIVAAKQETMRQLGLPVADEKACADTIGLSSKLGFKKNFPDLSEELLDLCVKHYRDNFERMKELVPPRLFDGVPGTLNALKEKGMVLTIATSRNRRSLLEFLEKLDLKKYFTYVLAAEDTKLLKPNAEPVTKTLEELRFRPEDALVVGDMPYDILMGRNAQVATCGVTYGNASRQELKEAGADYLIDSISELPEFI